MTRINIPGSLSLAIVIMGFLLPGCKKSNSLSSSVSATVNSANLQFGSIDGTFSISTNAFSVNGLILKDMSSLGVTFAPPFQLGVPIDNSGKTVSTITYITGNGVEYEAYSPGGLGHVVITITGWDSSSHRIAGTFSGSVTNIADSSDNLPVTNGMFITTYTVTN